MKMLLNLAAGLITAMLTRALQDKEKARMDKVTQTIALKLKKLGYEIVCIFLIAISCYQIGYRSATNEYDAELVKCNIEINKTLCVEHLAIDRLVKKGEQE